MFSRLYIENFRNLANQTISFKTKKGTLKQAAFFYGDNGVGKTSIIYALGFLKQTTDAFLYNSRIPHSGLPNPPFILENEAKKLSRLGSTTELKIGYELIIDREVYIYFLIFSPEGAIQKEILFKKTRGNFEVLFSYITGNLYLSEQDFNPSTQAWLMRAYNEHFGDYTFLSLLYYANREKIINLKKHMNEFLKRVGRYHLNHDTFQHQEHFNLIERRAVFVKEGEITPEFELFQNASAVVVTQVVKSIYPNIDHVRYKYERTSEGNLAYHLITYIKVNDTVQIAQQHQLPKSYSQLLEFCFALLDTMVGNALVYDDVNALFSSETLKFLISGMLQRTSVQIMMTFNTPELLNFIDPIFSYIFIEKDGLVSVRCIDDIDVVRDSHNILKRYESGIYNQYNPINSNVKAYKLLMWFEEYIISFKKKIGL